MIYNSKLSKIWVHLRSHRKAQMVILLFIMILASFSEIISIGAVLPFLSVLMSPDVAFNNSFIQWLSKILNLYNQSQLTFIVTIVFILAVIISSSVRIILMWLQTRLAYAIGADFSSEIYKKTLYQPYIVHASRNSSEIISGISTKSNLVVSGTILPMLTIFSSALILLIVMTALLIVNTTVTTITFGSFVIFYIFISLYIKKILSTYSKKMNAYSDQVIKAIQEGLGGIRDVLIGGKQEIYSQIYNDVDRPLRDAQANIIILGSIPRLALEAIGMVLIAIIAYQLTLRSGGMSEVLPLLGVLAVGAQRLLPLLQQIYQSWTTIRGNYESLENVLLLLEQPMPKYPDRDKQKIDFKKEIYLDKVSFKYSENENWALSDISLRISKGSRIGIIGATGSGKSTLLDVITALILPSQGKISIDGIQITPENQNSWQSHIAYVSQSIFLSDATIAKNIAFGTAADKIDLSKIKVAAEHAQIADSIEQWPKKYSTKVGERGIRLSGGQRQRIALARAFYKECDVIVFDEATSALDSETESMVIKAINSLDRKITMIFVAHRITTLKDCDYIFELESGRIRRVVEYSELISNLI